MTGTHARWDNQNVIARSDSPVGPSITHERRSFIEWKIIRRSRVQVFRKFAHDRNVIRHVIVRDLFALPDSERSADWLSKLQYKLARMNISGGKPMTRWNCTSDLDQRLVRQEQLETGRRLVS